MEERYKLTEEEVDTLLSEAFAGEPDLCERGLGEEPTAYVEKNLSASERQLFEEHLVGCSFCASEVARLYRAFHYLEVNEARIKETIAARIHLHEPCEVAAEQPMAAAQALAAAKTLVILSLIAATGRFRPRIGGFRGRGAAVFANEPTRAEFTSKDGQWFYRVRETEEGQTIVAIETEQGERNGSLVRWALVQQPEGSVRVLAEGFMVLHPAFTGTGCTARSCLPSPLEPMPWEPKIEIIPPGTLSTADNDVLQRSIAQADDRPSRQAWRDFIQSLSEITVNAEVLRALTASFATPDSKDPITQ